MKTLRLAKVQIKSAKKKVSSRDRLAPKSFSELNLRSSKVGKLANLIIRFI